MSVIDWRTVMDWVVFASCFVAVCTLIIDIIKSTKDKKSLSSEHNQLRYDNKLLKEKTEESKNSLSKEHSDICRQNEKIQSIVTDIDKYLYAEIEKSNIRYNNLSDSQKDIKKHIEAISDLMKELETLQTLSSEQKKRIEELTSENFELKKQIMKQQNSLNNDFTQKINFE